MLTEEELDLAERTVNEAVWADLPVTVTWFDDYEASRIMPVRKQVPHNGRVSVVTVGDLPDPYDCIACCGTHPSSSGQVGLVALYKCEPNKGMNRIYFDCGSMALSRLSEDSRMLADISRRYSCKTSDLPKRLDREAESISSLKGRLAALASYAAEAESSEMLREIKEQGSAVYTYETDMFSTDELLKRLENNPYGFIVVNYANCDMVGHTGDEKAATKAVEVTDECIGKILPRLLELDAHVLIFADHGNAEQMVDYKSGLTKTSHTLNLVDCFYVANDAAGVRLTPLAKLSAVAPTALQMLGIPVPSEMTTPSLLAGKEPWSKTALNV